MSRDRCRIQSDPDATRPEREPHLTVRTKYIGKRKGTLSGDFEIQDARVKRHARVLRMRIVREKVVVLDSSLREFASASFWKDAGAERAAACGRRMRFALAVTFRRTPKVILGCAVGVRRLT
jgi:hypothetical protein